MIKITPIPALADNYIWILEKEGKAIIFDPSLAQPVIDFLAKKSLDVTACLLTHNHNDHTDGVAGLKEQFPDLVVIGPKETKDFITQVIEPKEQFDMLGLSFEVIESAGHTQGHISYFVNNEWLFCGDSLFSAGCGRVFTGDYQSQYDALQRFKRLPNFVKVFPAHEYTQANLKFAVATMPSSCILLEQQERVDILRSQGKPTLPTTIGLEKQINPFMQAGTLAEFIALRQRKDHF